jgi:hypothetical protein
LDLKKTNPDSDACKSAKQVAIEFNNAINNSLEIYSKIEDHVEEAIIGITSIFCAFGTPQMHDMLKDNVLYLGKRLRRKTESEATDGSANHLLRRASADIEDFGNSLLNLKFGKLNTSFSNLLNKQESGNFHVARYLLAETEFLNSLMDISERLRLLPKANRQKTLMAELTLFNHSLPADVCLPLWCRASSVSDKHHKIVRISPSDAVVLNSAERVSIFIHNSRFHFLFLLR